MPVHLSAPQAQDLLAIEGVRIGVTEAGIRKANRKDLIVFLLDAGASSAWALAAARAMLSGRWNMYTIW